MKARYLRTNRTSHSQALFDGLVINLDLWPWGLAVYCAIHFLHILVWRGLRPQRQFRALALIFLLIGPLSLCWVVYPTVISDPGSIVSPLLLYFCLAAQYIAVFPAFQAMSPTIEFLYRLKKTPSGLTADELANSLDGNAIVGDRVSDLLSSGLAVRTADGQIAATSAGRLLGNAFRIYRKALGLPVGEG